MAIWGGNRWFVQWILRYKSRADRSANLARAHVLQLWKIRPWKDGKFLYVPMLLSPQGYVIAADQLGRLENVLGGLHPTHLELPLGGMQFFAFALLIVMLMPFVTIFGCILIGIVVLKLLSRFRVKKGGRAAQHVSYESEVRVPIPLFRLATAWLLGSMIKEIRSHYQSQQKSELSDYVFVLLYRPFSVLLLLGVGMLLVSGSDFDFIPSAAVFRSWGVFSDWYLLSIAVQVFSFPFVVWVVKWSVTFAFEFLRRRRLQVEDLVPHLGSVQQGIELAERW